MPIYSAFTPEQLANEVSSGNQKAFFELSARFGAMIHEIVNSCEISAHEKEDLYQEGLIGLYKAALSYDPLRGASFSTYAYHCIKHSIFTFLRVYFSKKNEPVRAFSPIEEMAAEQCPDLCTDPEKLFIDKESVQVIKELVDTSLSKYERQVFKLFLGGRSYDAIAGILSTSSKSVDNAIQRIRGKLKKFIK